MYDLFQNCCYEEVNPTDTHGFPGLLEMELELKDWSWIFGKTPKFSISRRFESNPQQMETRHSMDIGLDVTKGRINDLSIKISEEIYGEVCTLLENSLNGKKFVQDDISSSILTTFQEHRLRDKIPQDLLSWIYSNFINIFKT